MKRRFLLVGMLILVSFFVVSTAFASNGPPIGSCPTGFELHPFMHHEGHEDHHIGLARDHNGDGQICVKELPNGLHVHMDNVINLP